MNTNTKHTPGPWRAEKDETAEVFDIKCNLGTVAMTDDLSPKTNEANARLIASSPALLDALKNAVSYLEANRPKGKIREIFHQLNEYENGVLKPARAAIAQAEGGAQ
jgi:hypothetical protein